MASFDAIKRYYNFRCRLNLPKRPSDRELRNKLGAAKQALQRAPGFFVDPGKVVGELNDLDVGKSSHVWPLILKLLDEIDSSHYSGGRPPHKAYEKSIEGQELFAFSWASKELGKKMYLKS
jgi:hypothetical protein